MKIQDFLRPENIDNRPDKFMEALNRYIEHFGDGPITEPSTYTDEEWISILNECIEKNITVWELTGEEYDFESEY